MHDDDIENLRAFAAELRALTGLTELPRIIGHVAGLRSWIERGPELERENELLRAQVQSLALRGMASVDMMTIPLTDREPSTPPRGTN